MLETIQTLNSVLNRVLSLQGVLQAGNVLGSLSMIDRLRQELESLQDSILETYQGELEMGISVSNELYQDLHPNTKKSFPNLADDTRVFTARTGSNQLVGVAWVQHIPRGSGSPRHLRCVVSSGNSMATDELLHSVIENTDHLKRRRVFTVRKK